MSEERTFQIRAAVRSRVLPLFGFYGPSGGGKTFTSLLFARGFVGPKGRIVMIDTESGRGSLFADIPEIGGYSVIDLEPPFSPANYLSAFRMAEGAADIVIVDSASHMWEGEGGILEMQEAELERMAGQDWKKREQCKMAAWIKPKQEFKKWRNEILRAKVPLIVCFRGHPKTHMDRDGGKTVVSTDKFTTPIFDERFIFELLVNAEIVSFEGKGGFANWTKITHRDVAKCLPDADKQVSAETGKLIAEWCHSGALPKTEPKKESKPKSPIEAAKVRLWSLMADVHEGKTTDEAKEAVRRRLVSWNILQPGQDLADLTTIEQLQEVIDKVELSKNPQ